MGDKSYRSYFGSYDRRPAWEQRVHITGNSMPGYTPGMMQFRETLEPVTPDNFPLIYNALAAECSSRGVEMPACYVDHAPEQLSLGRADSWNYTIIVDTQAQAAFNPDEMRALLAHELKHLYQAPVESKKQNRESELDADRAAVEAVGYDTIRTYVDKAATLAIEHDPTLPDTLKGIAHKIHQALPDNFAEKFILRAPSNYPSPATRMRTMRQHDEQLGKDAGKDPGRGR